MLCLLLGESFPSWTRAASRTPTFLVNVNISRRAREKEKTGGRREGGGENLVTCSNGAAWRKVRKGEIDGRG